MLPNALEAKHFDSYPPMAKQIASDNIVLLRDMPLAFEPLLLRELIGYDWKFPAERAEIDANFRYLSRLSAEQRAAKLEPFSQLKLSSDLEKLDWVNDPTGFSEKLSAFLWSSRQMDQFRSASVAYIEEMHAATP